MQFSQWLRHRCYNALKEAFKDFPEEISRVHFSSIEITQATQRKFGHYQCNSAMKLTPHLKQPPRVIAERWVAALQNMEDHASMFEKIEIAGPGFLNFSFSPNFLSQQLIQQLQDPRLGYPPLEQRKKVILDFSSPNIAKEMHVGHLRSTILGDALARILEFLGHETLRLNHLGDWGTQFGMLIAYLKQQHPSCTSNQPLRLSLPELMQCYRNAKNQFDADEPFKTQSQREVVALQGNDPTSLAIWKEICAISKSAYQEIYQLLDVKLTDRGESFYNSKLGQTVQDLESKGLVQTSDGAKCIYLEGYANREGEMLPLIIQKSDGGYNYATTDLAALRQRVQEEKGDWLIYITDAGQQVHFQMFFEAAKRAGFYDPNRVRVDHVPFGLVLREDGKKFKTRSGDTERLIDLLQAAISKAESLLRERDPSLSESEVRTFGHHLGINAIKYADLSTHRTSDYRFSYDRMLQFEGNTAAFLNYAYVRIRSIQRKIQLSLPTLLKTTTLKLEAESEMDLALQVCQFSEILESTLQELLPNRLTDYLHRLAEKFHAFFHQCRVEGSPEQNSRLLLCEATAQVLQRGFQLLGLTPLEKM